jgi:putative FmdB family regulatory protein
MPTYHYRCKSCKHEFEEFQKMSDDPHKICPNCNKHTLVLVMSGGTGLVFKGSGFYTTDYRDKAQAASKKESKQGTKLEEKSDSSTATKSESSTGAKSESNTESTSKSKPKSSESQSSSGDSSKKE